MPAPLAVDKEAVRVLVVAVGVAEAARRMGLGLSVVKKWSSDGRWLEHCRPKPAQMPASMQPVTVTGVTKPADALADALADDSKQTRLSLSRSARRLAQQAEDAPLEQAGDALQVGKLAQLVHGWSNQQPTMRISMFGSQVVDIESLTEIQAVEVESVEQSRE